MMTMKTTQAEPKSQQQPPLNNPAGCMQNSSNKVDDFPKKKLWWVVMLPLYIILWAETDSDDGDNNAFAGATSQGDKPMGCTTISSNE